jgi:sugar phosphate isomerase/epimerase
MSKAIIGNPINLTHFGWPLGQALDLLAEMGFGRIELCRPDLAGWVTRQLRRQLGDHIAEKGMTLAGFNVANAEDFQALRSPDDLAPALASLTRDIDLAADLGATYLSTWEGRVPEGVSAADRHGWLLESTVELFRQAVRHSEPHGIDLLVEVHPFTLGIDVDWLVKLMDGVGSERFGVTYDSCHFAVGLPDGYIEAVEQLGSRIKTVHLSDSDKTSSELHFPAGKGCLDMDGIVAALKGVGFSGDLMVDVWLYPLPELALREGIAYLNRVME